MHDALFGRQVRLGRIARALVERMDGLRTPPMLIDEVAGATSARRRHVERSLRGFYLLGLIEGSATASVAAARQVRAGEDPGLKVLPEMRFACQGSGDCCQSYSYGPLSEDDLARLAALSENGAIEAAYPDLGPGPYTEVREAKGGPEHYLQAPGERCIFLLADRRCGLHAAFGADSKPGLCNLYPLRVMPTVRGVKIWSNVECSCFGAAARAGTPLHEQPEMLRALLPAGFVLADELADAHPVVHLDDHASCDYGHVLRLQDGLLALVDGAPSARLAVLGVGRMTRTFVDRVRGCPLHAGEPDASVEVVLRRGKNGSAYYRPGEPKGQHDDAALWRLLGALLGGAVDAPDVIPDDLPRHLDFRNGRQCARVLADVRALVGHRARTVAGPIQPALTRLHLLTLDPQIDEVQRLSLRQQIFGARLLADDRLVAGVLRLTVAVLVGLFAAGRRAQEARVRCVEMVHYNHGHMLVQRVLMQDELDPIFTRFEPQAWGIVESVGALLEHALPQPAAT